MIVDPVLTSMAGGKPGGGLAHPAEIPDTPPPNDPEHSNTPDHNSPLLAQMSLEGTTSMGEEPGGPDPAKGSPAHSA